MMMHLTGNAEGLIISKMKDKVKIDGYQSVAQTQWVRPVGVRHSTLLCSGGCHDPWGVHTALGVWL